MGTGHCSYTTAMSAALISAVRNGVRLRTAHTALRAPEEISTMASRIAGSTPSASFSSATRSSARLAGRATSTHYPRAEAPYVSRRGFAAEAKVPTSSLLSYKTLPNGIRVAGEQTPGHFSALGVYVNAGSRYERLSVPGESGSSHLLDRMAFKSTDRHSTEAMAARMAKLGGNFMAASSRETIMYQASIFNQDLEEAMSVFSDTIQHARLDANEVQEMKPTVRWEIESLSSKPDTYLPELLHEVAYSKNTLGKPLICPDASLPFVSSETIRNFMDLWYTPERIVIAGAGMPFEQLYEFSEKYFGDLAAPSKGNGLFRNPVSRFSNSYRSSSNVQTADFSTTSRSQAKHLDVAHLAVRPDLAMETAVYTGGQEFKSDITQDFTHVYVAFESMSIEDEDIYALSVLQTLLGGGGSFSAGGPGKGMYSRLYSNVLNQHHAVDHCAAFHHCYADTGLFGIAIAVDPSWNAYVPTIISRELELVCNPTMRGGIREEELLRAKNQLKSSLMMSLESRLIEVEDLGRQVQVNGYKVTVEEMCEKIDKVDLYNVGRVARRVFQNSTESSDSPSSRRGSGQATVVAMGKLEGLSVDIRKVLASRGLGREP